jgi:hypothetical protein
MKESMMLRTQTPFLATMLSVVLSTLFLVMTTAFIAIPYAMGGHPGESRVPATQSQPFHPT